MTRKVLEVQVDVSVFHEIANCQRALAVPKEDGPDQVELLVLLKERCIAQGIETGRAVLRDIGLIEHGDDAARWRYFHLAPPKGFHILETPASIEGATKGSQVGL